MVDSLFDLSLLKDPWTVAALAMCAVAWFFAIWTIGGIIVQRRQSGPIDRLEENRREKMREGYAIYRWFEPLIRELAAINHAMMGEPTLAVMQNDLAVARARLPWLAEEYLATKQVECLLLGFVLFTFAATVLPVVLAFLIAFVIAMVLFLVSAVSLPGAAAAKRAAFKRRMPFGVDILALLGEAGVGLTDGLRIVGRENQGHPLGDELSRVTQQLAVGKPLPEALETLRDRLTDDDVQEFVLAINRGIELGTPMATILKTQAEQMRLRRSQWGEKAAKQAEVNMTFPNLLIMLACVIVILGPILLPLAYGTGLGLGAE